MSREVLVVIGAGGIGRAIARRSGSGREVVLADFNEPALAAVDLLVDGGVIAAVRGMRGEIGES
jgi:saccharopine dehydrogenase-like NADP-dependent oxidoreductase